MPGVTGVEVCSALRKAPLRVRPYLLILTARNGETDITHALDSGADDFVQKPAKPSEMLARLRVAERTVGYQLKLQERLDELEKLLRSRAVDKTGASPDGVCSPRGNALTSDAVEAQVVRALMGLGIETTATGRSEGGPQPGENKLIAWAGFALVESRGWMDVIFQAESDAVSLIMARALNRTPSPEGNQLFMLEALGAVGMAFGEILQANKVEFVVPIARVMRGNSQSGNSLAVPKNAISYKFNAAGSDITMTVAEESCKVGAKWAHELKNIDIVAEDFPPAGMGNGVILRRGAVLDSVAMGKLRAYSAASTECPPVQVYELPPLAKLFCSLPPGVAL
jgi:hypothetical protein